VQNNKENPDLYTQLLQTNTSLQVLVENWIDSYKQNQDEALIDLINFLIRSCGCKGKLNKSIFKSKEYNDAINELIDYFDTQTDDQATIDYPIINSNVQFKRFKVNFIEFIQLIIQKCQHSILYDQFMLDNLIAFLICLSDSQIRAFRHTSTLCLVKIMTALIDVLLMLNITKDAYDRQYNSEKSKSQSKRALDRLENLSQKRKEMDTNESEIQNSINFIFKAVFIHRYRDVCADIRTLCIHELGEWMKKYPTKFLDDHFLKYIGWTLYDRQHEGRLKCLQILKPLYENKNLIHKLDLFTTRFKQRLIEMTLDKDTDVCVYAIKLLTCIIKSNEQLLEDKDFESIYELVFHSNRSIAQAAGEFLNQKLFDKVNQQNGDEVDTDDNKPYLLLLIQFLIESELHEHPTYLIDSMWDIHVMLKDWKCMTDLLLNEHQLDDLNEKYLIEIMTSCVKEAATGEYPVGRTQPTVAQTQLNKKHLQDDRAQLTVHFIQTITPLLTKYNSDEEKILNLLQIPLYFDLSQYKERRYEKHIDSLLEILIDIYLKNINIKVLNACSSCLAYLSNENFYNLYQKVNLKCSSIIDQLIVNFKQSMQLFSERLEVDLDELYPLIISLKRLAAFSTQHDILEHKQEIWSIVYTLFKAARNNESISFDIVDNCFNLIRNLICWSLKKINELAEENKGDNESENGNNNSNEEYDLLIEDLKKLTRKYYRIVNKLFVHENKEIEQEAYFELCDLLILFNKNIVCTNPDLKDFIIEVQSNDINMMLMYCVNKIFESEVEASEDNNDDNDTVTNDSVDKIEKLHKKRCILAAFCKLVMYNTIPMRYMAEICRGYSKVCS
jgi:cohesin complex subunit SA-1/2